MRQYILWFLLLFLANTESKTRSKAFKSEQNIGTVLFEKTDRSKRCWTNEEFTVLNSRRMFQDILPKANVIDYQNDRYIALLMDYFRICLESVRELSVGKTKHLILKALVDTMGGYLQAYILPLTKHSYYAGNIKYRNAKKLFELYDELKNFLRTNGVGWIKLRQEAKHIRTLPITITPSDTFDACDGLITYPAPSNEYNSRHFKRHAIAKRKKSSSRRRLRRNMVSEQTYNSNNGDNSVVVPLPFLDDEAEPNSIALPFKSNRLQSLYCEKSAFALVKYYIASVKCIASKSKARTKVESFDKEFFEWLEQSVHRHLDDEKWYPAFGGVLRVISYLEESGSKAMTGKKGGTYQVMPKLAEDRTNSPDEGVSPLYKGKGENGENETLAFGTTELIVIAVASALFVWLLVGLSLVCYRFLTRYSEDRSPCDSPNIPVAVLYDNTDYCQPETCSSRPLRTGLLQRSKDWWRTRFGKCKGECQDKFDEERCLAAISYTSKDTIDATNDSKITQKKKSVQCAFVSPNSSPRERVIFKKDVSYSSDISTTMTDSPYKSR